MYYKISTELFKSLIAIIESRYARKEFLDILCLSSQWLFDNLNAITDTVKIKKDKWQVIKNLALDTHSKNQEIINKLKDY